MDKTETKTVYAYSTDGRLLGERTLDHTDRSPISGAWQIPANMTETKPPKEKEGYDRYFNGTKWEQREIPVEPELEPVEEVPTETEPYTDPIEELRAQLQETQVALAELTENMIEQADTTQVALAEIIESIG